MQHQLLFKTIFNKNAWDSDNAELLQDVAEKYPYFGIVHFFLLKETGIGHSEYASIAGKAAIHFNNPYLLNLQMHKPEEVIEDKFQELLKVNSESSFAIENEKDSFVSQTISKAFSQLSSDESDLDEPNEISFEPLHTSDYFASQGIKLSEEVQSSDKLGKQLKSFTEWLKAMKKPTGFKLDESNATIDKSVEQMAEKSNENAEIITESMAEVFIQQGKITQAIEIYLKLSLLNPTKSIYFADKIELLKEK